LNLHSEKKITFAGILICYYIVVISAKVEIHCAFGSNYGIYQENASIKQKINSKNQQYEKTVVYSADMLFLWAERSLCCKLES
jgi:hypothetical protein